MSDRDRAARVGRQLDLIRAVSCGSGGQERLGARAAALGRRSSAPAAALRRRRGTGAAGLGSGPDLAVGHERGTRNPLEWKARCGGVRSGVLGGGGGSMWRRFAGEQRTST